MTQPVRATSPFTAPRQEAPESVSQFAERAAAAAEAPSPYTGQTALLVPRDFPFRIIYTAPVEPGSQAAPRPVDLLSRIPDFAAQRRVAAMQAQLAGGLFEGLSPGRREWVVMMSEVTAQLVKPPEWVLATAAEDNDLLIEIFLQCSGHRQLFFRADASSGQEATRHSRVEVHSELAQYLDAARNAASR